MILWIAVAVAFVVVALAAYLFGKYWLGLRAFRGHVKTINWSVFAGFPDWWHWGLSVGCWLNLDPGFHFTSVGFALRLGPFVAGAQGDDSN
jgi:hypothetical protein